jgi:type IV secretory pathway VirB2 component (pilin)
MDRPPPSDRLRPAGEPRLGSSGGANGVDDDQPSFLSMVGLVALVVAVVILVFFGIGYLFGRVFL